MKTVADFFKINSQIDVDVVDDVYDVHNECAWSDIDSINDNYDRAVNYINQNTPFIKVIDNITIKASISTFVKEHFEQLKRFAESNCREGYIPCSVNDDDSIYNGCCIVNDLVIGNASEEQYREFCEIFGVE